MEPPAERDSRWGKRSEVSTVDPAWAKAGFHKGMYHRDPHPGSRPSEPGRQRVDLPRDGRLRKPLRRATYGDTRDVRGGYYVTSDNPQQFGKKVKQGKSPWLLSSDDVVKKTRRFADPRGEQHHIFFPTSVEL